MTNYRSIPKPGQTLKRTVAKSQKPLAQQPKSVKGGIARQPQKTVVVRTTPVVYKPRLKSAVVSPPREVKEPKTSKGVVHKTVKATSYKSKHVVVQKASREAKRIARRAISNQRVQSTNLPVTDQYRDAVNVLRNKGRGKILVMIACGPSILEAPLEKLKNNKFIDTMCINKPDMRIWPANYWVFCDQSQYTRNQELFNSYRNLIINSSAVKARRSEQQIVIKAKQGIGWSRDLTRGYHIGRSTVYANMQTAAWMGYERIYIFGIDMCRVNGQLHFYGVNPDVKEPTREKRFKQEADNYEKMYQAMRSDERSKFIMCSAYNPWPFANGMFQKMDHRTAVDKILEDANKLSI